MAEQNTFSINGRAIGDSQPVYIIAEMSANHHQDLETARNIVLAAKDVGADAVKVQTYTADLLTLNSDKEWFQVKGGTLWDGTTLHKLYEQAHMPWEWHAELKQLATECGLDFFSTPTHIKGVDYLEELGVPVYKVPSFEIIDIGLLQHIARKGKPMILSTGMASADEIAEAVSAVREAGCKELALLKCTSSYPAPPEDANLKTIPDLAATYGVVSGLSDHTQGIAAPVAAVALGASIIEKHFTLDRSVDGPDSKFSLEPAEFKALVEAVRFTEQALGTISYGKTAAEEKSLIFRRSLFAIADIAAGESFSHENIASIRPGHGLHPRHLTDLIGTKAPTAIACGTPLDETLLD